MKKFFWMTALASVALASCVSEEVAEVENTPKGKEIAFGAPVMYKQSRSVDGEILGTVYPKGENFVVFAVETKGAFKGWTADNVQTLKDENNENPIPTTFFPAAGVTVQHSETSGHWHISQSDIADHGDKPYYWPSDEGHKLTFAAYSPARAKQASTNITYGDDGLTILGFKTLNTPRLQYDLMYSTRTLDATTSPVAINFKHALSSIRFSFVKPDDGAHSIQVTKLEVLGTIVNKGDFKQDIAANSPSSSGTPTWENREYVKNGDEEVVYELFSGSYEVSTTASEISNVSSFLPIPQNVTADMFVRVSYRVKQTDEVTDNYTDVKVVTIPFTKFLIPNTTTHTAAWEIGSRYVYHIHFGALKEIFFAPVISADWNTVSEAGVFEIQSGSDTPGTGTTPGTGGESGTGDPT